MGTEAIWVPLVAAALPAIIGAVGSMISSDSANAGSGAVGQAGADKLAGMQRGAQAYGAYRPQIAEAQSKALANQMAQYKPAETMLSKMYGGSMTGGEAGGSGGWKKPDPPPPPQQPPPPGTGPKLPPVPDPTPPIIPQGPEMGWYDDSRGGIWVPGPPPPGTGYPQVPDPNWRGSEGLAGPMTQGLMSQTPKKYTPETAAPMIQAMLGGSNVR